MRINLMQKYMMKLLYTIPTPFYESRYKPSSQHELAILFRLAQQNKVELLLLEYLNSIASLPYTFKEILMELRKKRLEMMITASRMINILEQLGYRVATFKSWTPFPAIPNDIDVIILDEIYPKEFKSLVRELVNKHGYQLFDIIPYAVSLHDRRCGNHINPKIKDPYDIDLYYEVSANRIIYLDKRVFQTALRKTSLNDEVISIYTLSCEYELLTQLVHSIFPEQIFLLYHYYIFLYFLKSVDIQKFLNIAKDTHTYQIIMLPLNIIIGILRKINILTEDNIAYNNVENDYCVDYFLKNGYYRFKIKEIISLLLGRIIEDSTFRKSFVEQILSLVNVKSSYHVLTQLLIRRTRTTY